MNPEERQLAQFLQTLKGYNEHRSKNKIDEYRPYAKQKAFHALGASKVERLLSAGNQLGKALKNGTPVLTEDGWKPVESLWAGDNVIAGDGRLYPVTGVYPQGEKDLYEVTFDDGASVVCCMDHLWKVKQGRETVNGARLFRHRWKVKALKDIVDFGGMEPSPVKRAVIPVLSSPAEQEHIPLPLDGYTIGLFIGDGCLRSVVSISTADPEIIEHIAGELPENHRLVYRSGYDYSVVSDIKAGPNRNKFMLAFKKLGLWGKLSYDKFVPSICLMNSPEVRLSVLQGLLDSDGSVSKDGAIEFSSASEQLAKDVIYLVRSLGGKAKYSIKKTQHAPSYRVSIRLPQVCPFRLKRKIERLVRPVSTCDERILYSVKEAGRGEATCISVASPDNTFVTKDFIVTHNTWAGSYEAAYHATGLYPDWWEGRRWNRPTRGWVGGESSTVVRDTSQKLLLGDIAAGEENLGTGAIPADCILGFKYARGVAAGVDTVSIKHASGGRSTIKFMSYEMQRQKWQGDTIDWVWFDEEPGLDIYSEGLARFTATGGMAWMTFTPLKGMSSVVKRFKNDESDRRAEVIMTAHDAAHITQEMLDDMLSKYPEHEHECRINGVPMQGEGRIFTISESIIRCEPFPIPDHWAQVNGIDFGHGGHPTAAVNMAVDRDLDIVYVQRCYRSSQGTIPNHASTVKGWGRVPCAWPHDGHSSDRGVDGLAISTHYKKEGVLLNSTHSQYPDQRKNSLWAGIVDMQQRLEQGRLRVFTTCPEWFEEYRNYHMEDGKVVKIDDDLLCATRYAIMDLRYAKVPDRNWYPGKPRNMTGAIADGVDFNIFR